MSSAPDAVLVVNAGSSSLKLRVIGSAGELTASEDLPPPADEAEMEAGLAAFLERAGDLRAAGHRVVHGGSEFREPMVVTAGDERRLEDLAGLAPLHNPRSLAAIHALRKLRPNLPSVACFDTSFHATLPAAAATYALPGEWAERWHLRRYGFHGLSFAYATRRAAELLGRPADELRVVIAHLGSGASLAAVDRGRSVDTTMGFTPLEGLVMATRSGSVDPGLLLWVQRKGDLDATAMERALEHDAGLLGLSGRSGDLREVIAGANAGDEACSLALAVYLHRLTAGIAAMAAAMNGLDALVFTGGVGEHSADIRAAACAALGFLGISVDPAANVACTGDQTITGPAAAAATVVVTAREDIEIARQVRAALPAG